MKPPSMKVDAPVPGNGEALRAEAANQGDPQSQGKSPERTLLAKKDHRVKRHPKVRTRIQRR